MSDGHKTNDPFVAFLYELARDRVPVGRITNIIRGQVSEDGWILSNKHLARIAEDWVVELRKQAKSSTQKSILEQRDEFRKRIQNINEGVLDL